MERLREPLLRFTQRFLGMPPLDGDPGEIGRGGNELLFGGGRFAGLAVVHRERAQDATRRRQNRRGPARAQVVRGRERAVALPQRIDLHVAHDDGLTTERRRAARARVRPDLEPVHGGVVGGGQPGRGPVTQPSALAVEEKNRAEHAGGGALDQRDDGLEDFGQRGAPGDPLEDVGLSSQEVAGALGGAPAAKRHVRRLDRRGGVGHRAQR